VAFQVSSETDSRSILGTTGADKLQGIGKALLITLDMTKPAHLKVSLITDDEIAENVATIVEAYSSNLSESRGDFFEETYLIRLRILFNEARWQRVRPFVRRN
jgi:DNA segregation ATPase FtsK/SpoIIIE-like protein